MFLPYMLLLSSVLPELVINILFQNRLTFYLVIRFRNAAAFSDAFGKAVVVYATDRTAVFHHLWRPRQGPRLATVGHLPRLVRSEDELEQCR